MSGITRATALLPAEAERREALEHDIGSGMRTFRTVGAALEEMRDSRLYRSTHDTFEDYCSDRWSIGKAYAYCLIEGAVVVRNLSPIGDNPAKLPIRMAAINVMNARNVTSRPQAAQ